MKLYNNKKILLLENEEIKKEIKRQSKNKKDNKKNKKPKSKSKFASKYSDRIESIKNCDEKAAKRKRARIIKKQTESARIEDQAKMEQILKQKEEILNDMVAQALKEAFSQMIGSSDSALTSRFGGNFTNSPVETSILEDASKINISGSLAIVNGTATIEGEFENAPYVLAMELPLLQALIGNSKSSSRNSASNSNSGDSNNNEFEPSNQLGVQHAEFNSLMPAADIQGTGNIGLLMDVTMNMTVELGRATMTIRDILGLGEGSIIELQKLAGEPVDLLVNGKLIAKGEVVVIDENFGVRVTDIINPMDRLRNKAK